MYLCEMFSVTWTELFFLKCVNESSDELLGLSITPPFSTVSVHMFFFVSTSSLNEIILYGTAVCSAVVKASRWILICDHKTSGRK